ncbi:glutathione S-transferase family protein [Sphingobium rhizovicinum]|uniref:Glutathione S-transferase family protein n=1 Tax=Sphingobium rhizovicinum TaxID=432308 RepID=A0ABV7NLN3_9SPHN
MHPRFVDPTRFEHHEDWFKAINPRGQVPALDHDGHIITESTVICEYLEDAFRMPRACARPIRCRSPRCGSGPNGWTNISAGACRPSVGNG